MSLLQDQSAEYFVAFLAGIKSVLPMEEVLNVNHHALKDVACEQTPFWWVLEPQFA